MYNTVRIEGEFAPPDMDAANGESGTGSTVTRYLNGYALLFADEQADGIYTNISNGIFIFVPDVQAEKELQAGETSCGSENVHRIAGEGTDDDQGVLPDHVVHAVAVPVILGHFSHGGTGAEGEGRRPNRHLSGQMRDHLRYS